MIKGMPSSFHTSPPKCDSCILGKQTKTPVPKKHEEGDVHRATRKLEKVWVDLMGPMAIESCTGNRYVMNIVDNFTNYPWSIPLKNKSESFNTSKIGNWQEKRKWDYKSEHISPIMVNSNWMT